MSSLLETLGADCRYALRGLRRNPVFTLTAVVVLGLGLGATTAVFSVMDSVILADLPDPDPGRLVRVFEQNSATNRWALSTADVLAIREQQRSFEVFGGVQRDEAALSGSGAPERVVVGRASAGFFQAIGVPVARGRQVEAADEAPGAPAVAVVSHDLAERRFGGVDQALGRALTLDGTNYQVVGVLAAGRDELGGLRASVWPALQLERPPGGDRSGSAVSAASGRGSPSRMPGETWRSSAGGSCRFGRISVTAAALTPVLLRNSIVGRAGRPVGLFAGAVLLVLLLAITNVATLVLVRASAREPESGGARDAWRGPWPRRPAAGHRKSAAHPHRGCGWAGPGRPRSAARDGIPSESAPDRECGAELESGGLRALGGAAIRDRGQPLTGRGAGQAGPRGHPGGLQAGRPHARRSPGAGPAGRRRVRAGPAVAGGRGAAAPELPPAAAGGSRIRPRRAGRGQRRPAPARYPEYSDVQRFWQLTELRLSGIPGAVSGGLATEIPPDNSGNTDNFNLVDHPVPAGQAEVVSPWYYVTTEYFHALGVTVLDGRLFTPADSGTADPVVVVSRSWAAKYFPGERAVGRRLIQGGCYSCPRTTIVGVVSDIRNLGPAGAEEAVYGPITQTNARSMHIVVRTHGTAAGTLRSLRDVLGGLIPTSRSANQPWSSAFRTL